MNRTRNSEKKVSAKCFEVLNKKNPNNLETLIRNRMISQKSFYLI